MSDPQEDARGPEDSAQDLEWVEPEELEPADDPLGDTLRAANSRYALALSTADAATLCDLFEPDGAIVDGSGPDVLGHEGLRDMAHYARERFAAVAFDIDVEWTKQDPLDPAVAHAAGTWRMRSSLAPSRAPARRPGPVAASPSAGIAARTAPGA